jgi:hypothetical protein
MNGSSSDLAKQVVAMRPEQEALTRVMGATYDQLQVVVAQGAEIIGLDGPVERSWTGRFTGWAPGPACC